MKTTLALIILSLLSLTAFASGNLTINHFSLPDGVVSVGSRNNFSVFYSYSLLDQFQVSQPNQTVIIASAVSNQYDPLYNLQYAYNGSIPYPPLLEINCTLASNADSLYSEANSVIYVCPNLPPAFYNFTLFELGDYLTNFTTEVYVFPSGMIHGYVADSYGTPFLGTTYLPPHAYLYIDSYGFAPINYFFDDYDWHGAFGFAPPDAYSANLTLVTHSLTNSTCGGNFFQNLESFSAFSCIALSTNSSNLGALTFNSPLYQSGNTVYLLTNPPLGLNSTASSNPLGVYALTVNVPAPSGGGHQIVLVNPSLPSMAAELGGGAAGIGSLALLADRRKKKNSKSKSKDKSRSYVRK